jgi:serine/threonine protein phosphatase PrpC
VKIGYRCDIGKKREINEDNILCVQLDTTVNSMTGNAGLFSLADGMGGHKAGEIASRLAVTEVARMCMAAFPGLTVELSTGAPKIVDTARILSLAVNVANKTIYNLSQKDADLSGMGTTIVAALVSGQDAYVINAGDSRCYIINENEIMQVSTDHSLAHEMVVAGLITAEEATTHPRKNVLTRVVGYEEKLEPESYNRKLYNSEHILLCSDGLWSVVLDQQIKEIVLKAGTPQLACDELIALANELGSPDNISVIVVAPENLPIRSDVLEAETQVLAVSGHNDGPASQQRKSFVSFFQKKHQ